MKKIRKGATLLLTTVALATVAVISAAFTGVYYTYRKMSDSSIKSDREKILLADYVSTVYEYYLKDSTVSIDGSYQSFSDVLNGLNEGDQLNVPFDEFTLRLARTDESTYKIIIKGETYIINSFLDVNEGEMLFSNYTRRN